MGAVCADGFEALIFGLWLGYVLGFPAIGASDPKQSNVMTMVTISKWLLLGLIGPDTRLFYKKRVALAIMRDDYILIGSYLLQLFAQPTDGQVDRRLRVYV